MNRKPYNGENIHPVRPNPIPGAIFVGYSPAGSEWWAYPRQVRQDPNIVATMAERLDYLWVRKDMRRAQRQLAGKVKQWGRG